MAATAGTPSQLTPEKLARNPSKDLLLQLDNTLDRPKASERKPLPDIRKSKTSMEVARAHNDFLPDEVMLALTQPTEVAAKSLAPTREKSLAISNAASRRPPANVWNHKSRRDKLKHLTDQAVCFCGAGRDISFLYDVPAPEEPKPTPIVKKDASKPRDMAPLKKSLELPDSLVPDEYRIVKNKGVMGLEYYDSVTKYYNVVVQKGARKLQPIDDNYTTQPEDHESHLTVFPSMKPTSRYEVMRLKEVMEDMMEKSGVNDEALESVGPTQMHNLIELIKKEQKIYNIIFHELIRQATIECSERGELLADIRQKYSDLLSKVPRQIRGLHDEVMAQRALDRRLTEEMFRFKAQIVALTSELTEVKEHDKAVTEQAKRAQEDLRSALIESQKNASLLGEYHDLYELQRQRLERLVSVLTSEKELWSNATYSLSIKVIEEGNMVTARRAYIAEKAWSKLAHHFTVLLSDKDTEVLTRLQEHMERWRDLIETFHISVKQIEDDVVDVLKQVKANVTRWIDDLKKNCLYVTSFKSKDGAFVKSPNLEKAKLIYADIKEWGVLLQTELDKFSGSILLANNDSLTAIEHEISGWTECGVEVFNRHRHQDEYPNDYKVMIKLNKTLRDMCRQYSNRVTGENGIAKHIIQINTGLELWEGKLVAIIHAGQNLPQSIVDDLESTDDLYSGSFLDSCSTSSGSHSEYRSFRSTRRTSSDISSDVKSESRRRVQFAEVRTQTSRNAPNPAHHPGVLPTQFKDTKEAQKRIRSGKDLSEWWKKEGQMTPENPLNKSLSGPFFKVADLFSGIEGYRDDYDDFMSEWMSFMEQLDDWVTSLDNCISCVGSVTTEEDKEKGHSMEVIDVHEMMRKAHMWSVTTNNSIDSEDSKYVEQVVQLHTQMVKWMVHILLRLAPDRPGTSTQSIEQSLVNSPPIADLVDEADILFQQLDSFSLLIHKSCEDIVRLRTQDRIASGDDLAEKELNDLQGLKYEAYHWIYAALILITELTGDTKDYKPQDSKFNMNMFSKARTATSHVLEYMESRKNAEGQSSVAGDEQTDTLPGTADIGEKVVPEPSKVVPPEEAEASDVLQITEAAEAKPTEEVSASQQEGVEPKEANVPAPAKEPTLAFRRMDPPTPTPEPGSRPESRDESHASSRPGSVLKRQEDLSEIEVIGRDDNTRAALLPEPSPDEPPPRPSSGKPMAVDSQKAYDALKTVQKLQVQLLETEQRAQHAEESEARKAAELVEALQQLRALERQMEDIQNGGPIPTPKPQTPATQATPVGVRDEPNEGGSTKADEAASEAPETVKKKSSKSSGRQSSKSKKK